MSSPSQASRRIAAHDAHRIAVIGGDGIGPGGHRRGREGGARRRRRPRHRPTSTSAAQRYLRDGEILSDATLDELRGFDAILLGAVGTPEVPPGVIERGLLLKMRFDLDLYVNQRPFVGTAPGRTEPHDFVVIRENTEGPYVGEGGVLRKGTPHEVATQGSVNTRMGVERCDPLRVRAGRAAGRRKHLTLVHKTNVLTFAGDLWQRTFNEVAAEYPQVGTAYNHVDAACIYFVQDPQRYDVIVTDNLFGDILTDLGGAVSAAASAWPRRPTSTRRAPARRCSSRCTARRPTSSAPARPTRSPAILSAALMLDFLGEGDAADRIRAACAAHRGTGSTSEIGAQIAAAVAARPRLDRRTI